MIEERRWGRWGPPFIFVDVGKDDDGTMVDVGSRAVERLLASITCLAKVESEHDVCSSRGTLLL